MDRDECRRLYLADLDELLSHTIAVRGDQRHRLANARRVIAANDGTVDALLTGLLNRSADEPTPEA